MMKKGLLAKNLAGESYSGAVSYIINFDDLFLLIPLQQFWGAKLKFTRFSIKLKFFQLV